MKLQSGEVFADRYKLVKSLGSGAFSEVWSATDTKAGNMIVALKIYAPDKGLDANGIEIFTNEFTMVFNFIHSYLIHPTSFDVCEGSPFLVLPYCEKGSAHKLIGKLNEREAAQFIHDVASGLEYLHDQELIHQDIKPDNILVDDSGKFMITDFGISTRVRSTLRKSVEEYANGSAGTMAYMAPERFSKDPKAVKASDIFSLGATVYELITGDAPFGDHGGLILKGGAEIPSLPDSISKELKDIIYSCLSLEPWDRPLASQLKDKTELYLKTGSWKKKDDEGKKYLKWAAIFIGVLLIGGGVFYWDYNRVKVRYYKDYVEQWGIPQGIHKLSSNEVSHRVNSYRFEFQNYKLRRLSRVNSQDVIVEHTDSEEKGIRADDMLLSYRKNGKIDYVKYLDKNGKVLSKRIYNENLNTMTFVRDDDYDTEINIASRTLAIDDSGQEKGQISRYLLTYDKDGYVAKVEYAGFQNVKTGDADGIFAKEYKRDHLGRIVEEKYLGFDGMPKSTAKGLGIKLFLYDDEDNWIESRYYTSDMQPSADEMGVPVYKMELDKWGNIVKGLNCNFQNELIMAGDAKISGILNEIDGDGFIIKSTQIGTDNKPVYSGGMCSILFKRNKKGHVIEQTYIDIDGSPTVSESGEYKTECIVDDKGNVTEYWYYGVNGELIVTSLGKAGIKNKYDNIGNQIETVFYGIDKKPIKSDGYVAGYRSEYDGMSQVVKFINLDENLNATPDREGVSVYVLEYDRRGNKTKTSYFDASGEKPVLSNENIAGWKVVYDSNGKMIERDYFGKDGKITQSNEGVAKSTILYDEFGYMSSWKDFDASGKMTSGILWRNDNRGNTLERIYVDSDGNPKSSILIVTYTYDNQDNQTECAYFDNKRSPAIYQDGYHKVTYVYNDRNQVIEQRYYGKDGKLTDTAMKYAIRKSKYDDRGNEIEIVCLNSQSKPCSDNSKVHKYINEFDSQNRLICQRSFNEEGKPCPNQDIAPEARVIYDSRGNGIEVSCYDGYGNLINGNYGYAYIRNEYDVKGNNTSEVFYDKNNDLCEHIDKGYCKAEAEYNHNNKATVIRFYDTSGELRKSRYAYQKYTYDESGHLIEEAYYNYNNKPCDRSANGFHKFIYSSFVGSQAQNLTLIDASGYTEYRVYVNGEWQQKRGQGNDTPAVVPSSKSLKSKIDEINGDCPTAINDEIEATEAYMVSSSTNTAAMVFRLKEVSKYDFSESQKSDYIEQFTKMKEYLLSELPSGSKLIVIVKDKAKRDLFKIQ